MSLFLLLFPIIIILQSMIPTASGSDDCQISTGTILSPSSSSWFSPSGRFAFGFHPEGDGFTVGILFNIMAPNNTKLIWNDNRDGAQVSNSATLKLTKDGLILLLASEGAQHYLFSDSSSSTHCASMLDSGNFVIFNSNNNVLWQTFDLPTDTIMGAQVTAMMFDRNGTLYLSSISQSITIFNVPENNTNNTAVIIYSVRIEPHGQLQVYSHDLLANTSKVLQRFPEDHCMVKGVCGHNSYCILSEDQTTPQCLCLPGFEYNNPNSHYDGCKTSFIPSYCPGNEPAGDNDSYTMKHVVFETNPIAPLKTFNSKDGCFDSCLEDCDCEAATYFLRKNMDWKAEPDEMILSDWVCKCYLEGKLEKLRLDEDVDMSEFERAVKQSSNMPLFLLFLLMILQPLLLPCETATATATASGSDDCQIRTGTILSPSNSSSSSWFSPSGRFGFGFHPEGDGFIVGILFNMAPNNTTTLIWNDNRDGAPVSNSATLSLTVDGLLLLLATEGQQRYLFYDSSSSTRCASMLDSGNFVIFNSNNSVLWQTFDLPTDTIMGGQTLQNDKKIVSSVSDTKPFKWEV
ncbi:hypothetical protein J5N97_012067 [Dioscorea zingiberensis]|uniref:Bulb-type lectin domain-containing protein n=1 Tax=Dioscorea zingiberensis TaxID=325984 RepID=A0A9D5HHH2_9LILI|nr:hypothetical protein J5N97_012067 [Dioscorea zingiberensis]